MTKIFLTIISASFIIISLIGFIVIIIWMFWHLFKNNTLKGVVKMETGMIQKIGDFKFELQSNGGKIDETIIDLFIANDYLVQKSYGGLYSVFKSIKDEDKPVEEELGDGDVDDDF